MSRCTIVIGSAGRRLYLVDWFRAALERLGLDGEVVVTENDSTSASFGYGDRTVWMPPYRDPAYRERMLAWFAAERPALFVSVNDYELEVLADGLADGLRALGCAVAGVSRAGQRLAGDKYLMARHLARAGVPVPRTVLGTELAPLLESEPPGRRFVVKHRHGSGSSGMFRAARADVADAVRASAASACEAAGGPAHRPLEAVVAQPLLPGEEFGVDGVFGFGRAGGRLAGVLARRKLRMRSGETDKAVTVDPARFRPLVARLGRALDASGLIDVDLIDAGGLVHVIDVNPRFGGGYPFVHVAGADAPAFLLCAALRRDAGRELLGYRTGVVSAKYEAIRVTALGGAAGETVPGPPSAATASRGDAPVPAEPSPWARR